MLIRVPAVHSPWLTAFLISVVFPALGFAEVSAQIDETKSAQPEISQSCPDSGQSAQIEKTKSHQQPDHKTSPTPLEIQIKLAIKQLQQIEAGLKGKVVISQERLRRANRAEARLAQQDKSVTALRASNAKLISDIADQFGLVRKLTNQHFELQRELGVLKKENAELRELLSKTGDR
jgi:hypothetical protein